MKTTKKLLNPRGYLSWSQIDLWQRNRERYVAKYFSGQDTEIRNSGLAFGKEVSEALENGEAKDVETEALLSLLPHYEAREYEARATLLTAAGSVELFGKIDTFGEKPLRFREYKTGRVAWTQGRADKHGQIRHYATMLYLAHGRMPTEAWLDWAETEERAGEVTLTGKIRSFKVAIGMGTILEHMGLIGRVAREVDEAYRQHLKDLT